MSVHNGEREPLLGANGHAEDVKSTSSKAVFRRLLFCALLSWVAFVCTQTPLLYAIREISCEIYYDSLPTGTSPLPTTGRGDRCAIHQVESDAAAATSLMVTLTTISGMLNLFTAQWLIKRFGVKTSLFFQTALPCLRNLCQTFAIKTRGRAAIKIFQWTQLITIFGGGGGFVLGANTMINHIVSPDERTGSFGIMQGAGMIASSIAYTFGGVVGDRFGDAAPFEVTLVLLISSTIVSSLFLPYVPPDNDPAKRSAGIFSAFAALRTFSKRQLATDESVKESKPYFGLMLLAVGSFTAVLATMFVPIMLQMTGTSMFGFRPTQNGLLMSLNSLVKGIFLTLIFPRIIKWGRARYAILDAAPPPRSRDQGELPTEPAAFEPPRVPEQAAEPPQTPEPTSAAHGSRFDLVFLKWSTFVDALLTAPVALSSKGAHLYIAAVILPFASGTASAAKGVVLDIVPKGEQQDALAGISLIETAGMISTVSIFGWIFSLLSNIDRPELVFALNAATALIGTMVLLFVRFPPRKVLPLESR